MAITVKFLFVITSHSTAVSGPRRGHLAAAIQHLGSLHHLAVPSPKVLESSAGSSAKREGERVENPECRKLKWPSLEGSPISCHFPLVSIWSRSPTSLQAEAGKCGWAVCPGGKGNRPGELKAGSCTS